MSRILNFGRRLLSLAEQRPAQWREHKRGNRFTCQAPELPSLPPPRNHLREFFNARKQGRGIWKFDHYFDIYDHHFKKLRGKSPTVVEIGVFSGGSLDMWSDYFGSGSTIYGVDIEPACKQYETGNIKIMIGDQADRGFWRAFKRSVPSLDIVIDDGGHNAHQQIATFEELFPHLRAGGVFLCEDIHGQKNGFAAYVHGLSNQFNEHSTAYDDPNSMERRVVWPCTPFQRTVSAISLYPYVAVIEKRSSDLPELVAPKHGTEWGPFKYA